MRSGSPRGGGPPRPPRPGARRSPARLALPVPCAGASAPLSPPPGSEPRAGRIRIALWRLRRFLHGSMHTTVWLLRHGDRLLIAGSISYYAFDMASLGCTFQAFGGGAPPLGIFVLAY